MWKFVIFCVFVVLVSACTSLKKVIIRKDANKILNESPIFKEQFTGFSLYDIETNEFLIDYNADKKFTPASNTKLLTMYSVLKTFNDSIPGLIYKKTDEGLIVAPTGDPTFLHPKFKNQKAFNFLKKSEIITITYPKNELKMFGNGWAWDDYTYDYQPQRSWWPIYANTIRIIKKDTVLEVIPEFFTDYVEISSSSIPGEQVSGEQVYRDNKFNIFKTTFKSDTSSFERVIPYDHSKELLVRLLNDTLNTSITTSNNELTRPDTLYSQSVDFMLAMMMKPSDNFLAEQLLIQAAWKNGFNHIRPFMYYAKNKWMRSLSEIKWVDGSGLSRYNLISPNDQVKLLKLCYDEFGIDRLKWILPKGGEGTLRKWYISEEPYIYAKTGTLSNNHNLSGFLITRSGKTMIFSLMNNHYIRPTTEVKKEMQRFLNEIRDAY
ncbi:MAG: D-alanyl-D-alanine carboxypeptidase [Ekhidna sp.]